MVGPVGPLRVHIKGERGGNIQNRGRGEKQESMAGFEPTDYSMGQQILVNKIIT